MRLGDVPAPQGHWEAPYATASNAELLDWFERDTYAGASRTPATYHARIRSALRRYRKVAGVEPSLLSLIFDPALVAAVLSSTNKADDDSASISVSTVRGTFTAFQAFVGWVPVRDGLTRGHLRHMIGQARELLTTERGLARVFTTGERRAPAVSVPIRRHDVELLVRELRTHRQPFAESTADLLGFLFLTGVRVGAALALRRRDLMRGPGGRWYVAIREKSRHDRRLVLVRAANRHRLLECWSALGPDEPLWQDDAGHRLTYYYASRLLAQATAASGVEQHVVFHGLRHGFATDLALQAGIVTTRLAGGWSNDAVAQRYVHGHGDLDQAGPRQLSLGIDVAPPARHNPEGAALRVELREFERRLTAAYGLTASSAASEARHLASMVRATGVPTLREFFSDPALIMRAIREPERHAVRRDRHRAAIDAAEVGLAGVTGEELRELRFRTFPGRRIPRSNRVDIDLGGDTHQVHPRVFPTWNDGYALIAGAAGGRSFRRRLRDRALVGMHVRSSLPPSAIVALDWCDVAGILDAPDEFVRVALPHHSRLREFVIHSDGIALLRELHGSLGRPRSGPVFSTSEASSVRIAQSTVAWLFGAVIAATGFKHVDRRHMRAALCIRLLRGGWDELVLRDLFGYRRVAELRALQQGLREIEAQRTSSRVLALDDRSRVGSCQLPLMPVA